MEVKLPMGSCSNLSDPLPRPSEATAKFDVIILFFYTLCIIKFTAVNHSLQNLEKIPKNITFCSEKSPQETIDPLKH